MSDFKDKEPELPNYLKKDFDDSTKRIEVIREETQKVEVIKEEINSNNFTSTDTQVLETIKPEELNLKKEESLNNIEKEQEVKSENAKSEENKEDSEKAKKVKVKKQKKPLTIKRMIVKRIIFLILFLMQAPQNILIDLSIF